MSSTTLSRCAIGDLVDEVSTWNPSRECNGTFRYIDIGSIDQAEKSIQRSEHIPCSEAPSRARQIVKAGDVLVSTVRPNLNAVARVPDELDGATASTGFCVLRPRANSLESPYLFHWVKTPDFISNMVRLATGASYPAVSDAIVKQSLIPLPDLNDQRRIAAILDKAEAVRVKRVLTVSKLNLLVPSLFEAMFGEPKTNPHRFPVINLGEMIVEGPQNGLYKPASDYGSGTPILRIDGFYSGRITDLSALKRVRLSNGEAESYELKEGDIVINRVNSLEYLGKSAVVPNLLEPTVFESNMMRFRLDEKHVLPSFLIQLLQTPYIYSQILRGAKNAVNQSSINQQDVKGFRICVPPIELQREFAHAVGVIQSQQARCDAFKAKADEAFASMQNRAFRGDL